MKKIMIMTASTGGGHNQVAKTLKEKFEKAFYEVSIVDFLENQSKIYELVVVHGYEILASRFPTLYGELYKMTNKTEMSLSGINIIRKAEKIYTKKIIKTEQPDLIITTHPFAAAVTGEMKQEGKINVPIVTIVTDFIAHQSYVNQGIDVYVVGSEFTKNDLVQEGIEENKIHAIGIPLSDSFHMITAPKNKQFTVLIMGGSMGLSQMKTVVDNLSKLKGLVHLIIVTGKNEDLYKKLIEKYEVAIENDEMEVYSFHNEISKLMDQAHLIITKPGGLTVSESISKLLPMIVPFYIPGQEYENLMFLALHGAAIPVESIDVIPMLVKHLMENINDYERMRDGVAVLKNETNPEGILKIVNDLLRISK